MGLIDKVFGNSYKIKIIRRQVRGGNVHKVVEDRAALIEDEDTGEKKLKFKSDGKVVPKPSNLNFDSVKTSGFLSSGSTDMLEVEEDGDTVSVISFKNSRGDLVADTAEKEHLFQTHRNFMNKKTRESWSDDDNTELIVMGTVILMLIIDLAGTYFIVNGMQDAIIEGISSGFQNLNADIVTGN